MPYEGLNNDDEIIFDESQMNDAMMQRLKKLWMKMSPEQQSVLRAQRSKRGVKCSVCGSIGYYRPICPNACRTPDPSSGEEEDGVGISAWLGFAKNKMSRRSGRKVVVKEESESDSSSDSEVSLETKLRGVGVFWGTDNEREKDSDSDDAKPKVKASYDPLDDLRPSTLKVRDELRISDKKDVRSFDFFTHAKEGYARNLSELTLHQVLRRLMRLLEQHLNSAREVLEAGVDKTLLHPPHENLHVEQGADPPPFYPKQLENVSEYKDYFYQKESEIYAKLHGRQKNHQYIGCFRPVDSLKRSSLVKSMCGKHSDSNLQSSQLGICMHSIVGWKSVTCHSDALASSDPKLLEQMEMVDSLFKQQGQWVKDQKLSMERSTSRFEHLIYVCNLEMEMEHAREERLLLASMEDSSNVVSNKRKGLLDASKTTLVPTSACNVHMDRNDRAEVVEEMKSIVPYVAHLPLTKRTKQRIRVEQIKIWVERLGSVDRILETLKAYEFIGGLDELDYLMYMLEKWRSICQKRIRKKHTRLSLRRNSAGSESMSEISDKMSGAVHSESNMEVPSLGSTVKKKKVAGNSMILATVGVASPYSSTTGILDEADEKKKLLYARSLQRRVKSSFDATWSIPPSSAAESQIASPNQKAVIADINASTPKSAVVMTPSSDSCKQPQLKLHVTVEEPNVKSLSAGHENPSVITSLFSNDGIDDRHSPSRKSLRSASSQVSHRALNLREKDARDRKIAVQSFKRAGLKRYIRTGSIQDEAAKLPALIPIPDAFTNNIDGAENFTRSHAANDIIDKFKHQLVISELGYTPKRFIPLYVRNTLVEENGCTAGGDQTQATMAKDARYTHTLGRPLNRFEKQSEVDSMKKFLERGKTISAIPKKLAPIKERPRAKVSLDDGMNRSLVRMVFGSKSANNLDL